MMLVNILLEKLRMLKTKPYEFETKKVPIVTITLIHLIGPMKKITN